ncbi:hypothetical protein D3C80_1063870 [compost metagenome]
MLTAFAGQGDVVIGKVQLTKFDQLLDAGGHRCQQVATQIQATYPAEALQEAGLDIEQAHITQTQARDMAEIHDFGQARQCPYPPAMDEQLQVAMGISVLTLPGTANHPRHPGTTHGLDRAGGLSPPVAQGAFENAQLVLMVEVALPRGHALAACRGDELLYLGVSETWKQTPDRLAQCLCAAFSSPTERVAEPTIPQAHWRAHPAVHWRHAQ